MNPLNSSTPFQDKLQFVEKVKSRQNVKFGDTLLKAKIIATIALALIVVTAVTTALSFVAVPLWLTILVSAPIVLTLSWFAIKFFDQKTLWLSHRVAEKVDELKKVANQ